MSKTERNLGIYLRIQKRWGQLLICHFIEGTRNYFLNKLDFELLQILCQSVIDKFVVVVVVENVDVQEVFYCTFQFVVYTAVGLTELSQR